MQQLPGDPPCCKHGVSICPPRHQMKLVPRFAVALPFAAADPSGPEPEPATAAVAPPQQTRQQQVRGSSSTPAAHQQRHGIHLRPHQQHGHHGSSRTQRRGPVSERQRRMEAGINRNSRLWQVLDRDDSLAHSLGASPFEDDHRGPAAQSGMPLVQFMPTASGEIMVTASECSEVACLAMQGGVPGYASSPGPAAASCLHECNSSCYTAAVVIICCLALSVTTCPPCDIQSLATACIQPLTMLCACTCVRWYVCVLQHCQLALAPRPAMQAPAVAPWPTCSAVGSAEAITAATAAVSAQAPCLFRARAHSMGPTRRSRAWPCHL